MIFKFGTNYNKWAIPDGYGKGTGGYRRVLQSRGLAFGHVTPHRNCCCFQSERMRFFPGIETDGGETTEFLKCFPIAKPRWVLQHTC